MLKTVVLDGLAHPPNPVVKYSITAWRPWHSGAMNLIVAGQQRWRKTS